MKKMNEGMHITISKSNSRISVKASGLTSPHHITILEELLSSLVLEESTAASTSSSFDSVGNDWDNLELEDLD